MGNNKFVDKGFCFKKCILCIDIEKHRLNLSRLRCSAHKLMIEEGIYRNIDRNNRICSCCSMKLTEDEFDILLVCPAYRDLQKSILPR